MTFLATILGCGTTAAEMRPSNLVEIASLASFLGEGLLGPPFFASKTPMIYHISILNSVS